jgi:hypothetical protein
MPDNNGITLAEAKTALAKWMTADAELATGAQSSKFSHAGVERQLTRADAAEIRRNIEFWDTKVRQLAGGGVIQVYGIIPPC